MLQFGLNKYRVMNKIKILISSALLLLSLSCKEIKQEQNFLHKRYTANWDSLAKYKKTPEWFKEAKFGIYAHWGVLSVPEFANDWYPRNMHIEGTKEYKHHVETYGKPSVFGYHDFVPFFKAEEFNAEAWADLFQESGAKFAGIVAEHHDGWSNWASETNPWNSMDKGPRRDLVGELEKAIHSRGMKFVTTFHKARNLQIFQKDSAHWQDDTSYFPYHPDMPTSSSNLLFSRMYGNIDKKEFYKDWLAELNEVIQNYGPDLIYFDSKLDKIPDSIKAQFVADYFNYATAHKKEVAITHKEGELPKSVSLEDFEKGRMNDKTEAFWLTDETISEGSWSYTNDLTLKTSDEIIDLLADIVSKNGALMLNISPRADGIIQQNQRDILSEIGQWLTINGEAIYNTRTWEFFGEGPTKQEKSGMFLDKITYSAADIRYTKKQNTVYAIMLGWPGSKKEVVFQTFAKSNLGETYTSIQAVSILGTPETPKFKMTSGGLIVTMPEIAPNEKAVVVKIEFNKA